MQPQTICILYSTMKHSDIHPFCIFQRQSPTKDGFSHSQMKCTIYITLSMFYVTIYTLLCFGKIMQNTQSILAGFSLWQVLIYMETLHKPWEEGLAMAWTYLPIQVLHPSSVFVTVHIQFTELHKHKVLLLPWLKFHKNRNTEPLDWIPSFPHLSFFFFCFKHFALIILISSQ